MHNPLEQYLHEVAERLGPLPVARRNEELKEIRQHLFNAVIVNREIGQNDEEAAMSAVEQLGMPEEVAQGLIDAWRREKKLYRRDFWGAAATTLALSLLMPTLIMPFVAPESAVVFPSVFNVDFYHLDCRTTVLCYLAITCIHFVAGAISGLTFKKRTVAGAALAAVIWTVSLLLLVLFHYYSRNWLRFLPDASFMIHPIYYALLTVFGAFLASRWRETQIWRSSQRYCVR